MEQIIKTVSEDLVNTFLKLDFEKLTIYSIF